MNLGERIKALRFERAMTQKELGTHLDVSEVSIRCWESNTKSPSMKAIIALSKLFCVSTDYLLGVSVDERKDNLLLTPREKSLISEYRCLDIYGQKVVMTICSLEKDRVEKSKTTANIIRISDCEQKSKYIPHYLTPSAAGRAAPLDGDDFEMIQVDETVPAGVDFAVSIQGNSMLPYIHDGDIVYVKKECDMEIGDVGIFCVDGAMYCKQYYKDEMGNLILVSANPEFKNTNVFISVDSGSTVRCYGKVILESSIELPKYLYE